MVLERNSPAVVTLLTELITAALLIFIFGFFPELKKYSKLTRTKGMSALVGMGVLAGVCGPLFSLIGYSNSAVLNGVLLITLQSPIVILGSAFFLREKIRWNHTLGMIVLIIGLIAYETKFFLVWPQFVWNDLFFFLSAVAFAASNIIYKKHLSHISHELVLIIRNLIGGLLIFAGLILFSTEGAVRVSFDFQSLTGIGLIVLVPIIIAQSLWYTSLEKVKNSEAAFFDTLYPLFATLFAFILRHEVVSREQIIGGIIMIVGLMIAQIHWRRMPGEPILHRNHVRLQYFKQH